MPLARNLVGADLGGTKLAVARLEDGELTPSQIVKTHNYDSRALIDELVAAVERMRTPETEAVGLGIPSVIEYATGRVRASVNVPFEEISIKDLLGERLQMPVYIDNDANCAALAEAHDGERFVVRNLVMFTVGTGVGGGLILDGAVYRGVTTAAEIGHTIVAFDPAAGIAPGSDFPRPGSLEALASGSTLDAMAISAAQEHPDSALGQMAAAGKQVAGAQAVEAATDGDGTAIGLLRTLGEHLGIGIANAINTFDPDVVAIGGGVSSAGELLLGPAREAAAAYTLPGIGEHTEIRIAKSGRQAGVRGAALLAGIELAAQSSQSSESA